MPPLVSACTHRLVHPPPPHTHTYASQSHTHLYSTFYTERREKRVEGKEEMRRGGSMGRVRLMPAKNSQDSIRKLLISVKVWYLQRERSAVPWTLLPPLAWKHLRPLTTHSFLPVISHFTHSSPTASQTSESPGSTGASGDTDQHRNSAADFTPACVQSLLNFVSRPLELC